MASQTKPTNSAEQKDVSPYVTVHLREDEIDERASGPTPYFTVDVNTDIKCYIGTQNQDLLHDPRTYSRDWTSNQSVVLYIPRNLDLSNKTFYYTFSNVVIPNTFLGLTTQIPGRGPVRYYIEFDSTQSPQRFKRATNPNNKTEVAYYTTYEGQTYYLEPFQVGSQKSIVAVQANSPDGKYYFSLGKVNYP